MSDPELALLLFVALPAAAGRPLTTEDASIVEARACQVEAWVDRTRGATTGWLVPACNFGADLEWEAGAARQREDGRSRFAESYAQVKTVFANESVSPWKLGLVLGVTRAPLEPEHNGWENPYAIVPVTLTPPDTQLAVHANLGWRRDRAAGRHFTLWGIAAEAGMGERFTLLGEAFGENAGRPTLRAGVRYTAIRDRLELDFSYAARPGGPRHERLFSLGVTWQSGRISP